MQSGGPYEAANTHAKNIEATEKLLRDLTQRDIPWGGVPLMIFFGDFMQIAPITNDYSDLAAISASFKLSHLWQNVEVFRLTTNYRQHHDPEYAHDITQIGLGRSKIESGFSFTTPPHSNAAHVVKIPTSVTLSDDDLIAHAYPTAASAGHSVTCTYFVVKIILISCNCR